MLVPLFEIWKFLQEALALPTMEENEQQHTSQMIARGPALNAIKVTTLMCCDLLLNFEIHNVEMVL